MSEERKTSKMTRRNENELHNVSVSKRSGEEKREGDGERETESERKRERERERESEREAGREEVIEQGERYGCAITKKRKTPTDTHLSSEATRWPKRMSMPKYNVRGKEHKENDKAERDRQRD